MGAKIASLGGPERNLGPDSPEGIRIASLRSLAAEAGLKIGPVTEADIEQAPELAVVEALTGQPATQSESEKILESRVVNENEIRFIYTTGNPGSRPTDFAGDQGNLGGAYESTSGDAGGSPQADAGKSGSPKEEGARRTREFRRLTEFAKSNGLIMPKAAVGWVEADARSPGDPRSHRIRPRHAKRQQDRVCPDGSADFAASGFRGPNRFRGSPFPCFCEALQRPGIPHGSSLAFRGSPRRYGGF